MELRAEAPEWTVVRTLEGADRPFGHRFSAVICRSLIWRAVGVRIPVVGMGVPPVDQRPPFEEWPAAGSSKRLVVMFGSSGSRDVGRRAVFVRAAPR